MNCLLIIILINRYGLLIHYSIIYMYMSKIIHHECEYKEVRRATKKCNKQETRKTKGTLK